MIYFFDKNMELKKLVISSNVYNPTHQQVKNGMILAQLEFDIDYAFMFIDKVEYFGYFYNEVFYLHRIKTVEPDFVDNIMTVAGNHIFFDDMIGYNYIKDVRPFNRDANYVLQDTIGAVTRWEIVMTDATASLSSSFYYLTPMEALEQIVKDYQVEYEPRILFDGKKINGYQLHVANKLGNQDAKRVRFGDKVLQLKYDIDYSDISTAVIGRGKGEEVGDGYGRRIEFTDINFSRNGVVSPVGKNYMEDPRITDLYGYDDGTPKYEIVIFEDIENVNQLAEATYNYYVENAKPKMLFETEVTDIGIKHIGDSLLIVKPENNLAFKVRVEKIDVNLHNPEVPTMELGDYEYFQESKVERKTRENNEKVQGELSDRIAQLKREANERFDKIVEQWKSEYEQVLIDVAAEVEAMRVTMTEEFETAQREFEEEFNQSVADAKKHADDVADAKANQVQGNLDSFKGEHDRLVGELQGNIIDINGELDDARADVSGILGRLTGVDGSISGIKGSLTEIEGTLTSTKTQLESQITDARTELEKSINDARAELEGFDVGGRNYIKDSKVIPMTSADSGARDNTEHISTDDYIEIKSNKDFQSYWYRYYAINTDNRISDESIFVYDSDYQTFGIDILTESDNFEMYINQRQMDHSNSYSSDTVSLPNTNGKWQRIYITLPLKHDGLQRSVFYVFISGGKASNPNSFLTNDYIRLKESKLEKGNKGTDWTPAPEDTEQKITNINQTITNIEGELSSKVEQSEVDTLKGTVERQGTLLTQTAEEVSSKAEKSVVDTLTGRVSNAESSVTQNAEEIATKVSSTEFDALTDIVSDSTTAITQNTQNISLKANQSELNQVTNRVASAESELSVQAGEIELRATKSELDDVEGRVTATEASLRVANGQISSVVGRVTEAETEISSVVQDVKSITSTVTSLEDDVATQGSQITQTKDVIESKVWLDDVANINPNLIPFTDVSAKESKPHWNNWGSDATDTWVDNLGYMNVQTTDTNSTIRIQSEEFELEEGQEYTLSFLARTSGTWNTNGMFAYTFVLWPGQSSNQMLPSANHEIEYLEGRLSGLRRITHTFIARHTGKVRILLGTYKVESDGYARFSFKEPKLEKGSERTPFLNAFSNIEQTANTIKLSVLGELEGGYVTKSEFDVTIEGIESRVSKIDGGGVLKQSDISVTSDSVIIGSQEISNTKLASIIAVSPSAVNIITNKLNLTGNLNVKGQIESISTSAVKADFANIFAGTADIQFIVAKHLASDSIQTRHLLVTNAMAEKIIANTVMAREVKSLSLDAVEANIGSIRSKILTSNVIKSTHIAGGTALIDKIYSSTAMFERMMSKSGFVTTLNTVTIDTDQITIRRPDGARLINNGMLRASFDVQIRPNHASSAVSFTGINYTTSSSTWQTFEHFYTDFKGSKMLISWAVSFEGPSASEYVEVRVRGFGGNNPIGTSNKRIFTNGSTVYLNQIIDLGVPDYSTIQAYLEFRRSPNGSSPQNTVRARVLRVSMTD